jgi:hypothetical protein
LWNLAVTIPFDHETRPSAKESCVEQSSAKSPAKPRTTIRRALQASTTGPGTVRGVSRSKIIAAKIARKRDGIQTALVIPSAAPFSLLEWQIVDRRYFGWFLPEKPAHIHGENAAAATLLSLMLELNLRVALRLCVNPIA